MRILLAHFSQNFNESLLEIIICAHKPGFLMPGHICNYIATVILAQAYGIACMIDWLYEPGLHNFATVVEVMQCYRISTRTNF